ncbi:hypothetical protein Trydic_g12402 [Trypoxylus dichotomus]
MCAITIEQLAAIAICSAVLISPVNAARGHWKIVGGTDAEPNAYPFVVSLRAHSNSHFCGGTILNTKWILTASHCVIGRDTQTVKVVAGTNTLDSGGITMETSKLIVHDDYDEETVVNDIALILLVTTIIYTDKIRPVTLNTGNIESIEATFIGWGRTSNGGALSNNLQELSTTTISHASCEEYWQTYVTEKHICALSFGKGACDGDSGGPLIRRTNKVQIGITSFVLEDGCAIGYPDVHTRVSSYIDWIISTINNADSVYLI